ncbi:MAG: PAS domain S-box protein, partial [Candidatus Neomarinimicrobiota bacterium]
MPLGAGPDCLGLVVYNSLRELSREEQDRIRRLVSQMAAALTYLQAEERLRERDERFRSLLDTAHDAIIGMDQNWNINIWNTAAESLFGYSPAEALGKPLHALLVFPEDLISSPEEGLKEFQKSGTGPLVGQTVEVVGRHRSGERIPVELSVSAYRLGDHWMATGILRDIRERKRAERIRETLARITHRLTVRLSPEQIGPIIAGEIRRLIPFHAFGLYELDWDRSVMRSLYNEDTPEGGRHPVPVEGGVQSFHTMNFKDVLQGKSILKNRTRVPNLSTLSPFGFEHRASLSLLFAPIIWNDKAIGYITIQSYDRGAYQRLDLQVLEMVAGQISGAFQRARAEQTLLIQQTAIEQNPASIIVTDPNGTIQYVNPGFTRIIGYEAREVLGKNPRMWKSGKHDRAFYQHLWNTIKSGQVWTGELCNRRKGGELYWESASIAPVVDRDGRILRFVAVKEDITPQIEARRRLAESERRLRTIVNALPLGVVIHQDGKLVLANPYAVENLGYDSAEEILGRSLAEFIHPDDREASARRIGHILKTGEDMVSARTRVLTRDGRVIDTFTHGARVTYGGKPAVVVGVVDITESIRQEEALRASEEKFRTLFEESRDAIYISRESGELLEFNPATRKLFGYSRKELKKINVTSLYVDAEDRKRFQREIKRVGYVQEFATRLRKKDGTILHALITAVRRETPEGVVFQGIIRDVTRDIRNRQKLEQALQQAQVADRVKTLFLANMSHEIRTPLNSLLGFMEYIEAEFRDQASPEVQAMFDALHD